LTRELEERAGRVLDLITANLDIWLSEKIMAGELLLFSLEDLIRDATITTTLSGRMKS